MVLHRWQRIVWIVSSTLRTVFIQSLKILNTRMPKLSYSRSYRCWIRNQSFWNYCPSSWTNIVQLKCKGVVKWHGWTKGKLTFCALSYMIAKKVLAMGKVRAALPLPIISRNMNPCYWSEHCDFTLAQRANDKFSTKIWGISTPSA